MPEHDLTSLNIERMSQSGRLDCCLDLDYYSIVPAEPWTRALPPELAKRVNGPVLDPWNVLACDCVLDNRFIPSCFFFLSGSSSFHTPCVRPLCRPCSVTVALGHVFFPPDCAYPSASSHQLNYPHHHHRSHQEVSWSHQSLPCLAWLISSFSPPFWPLPPLLPPPTPANPPCLTNP